MSDYERLLDRARSALPATIFERKRFKVPLPTQVILGSKTVIQNYGKICKDLNRDPRHLLRFLLRELGTAGMMDGHRAILQGQFPEDVVKRVFKRYVDDFVICPICKRPDTRIIRERRLQFLLCEACGAKSSLGYLR
ncbi:TPA: translation initiation factor IF-2 subunit beta [Candidatus Bathyarchaeota archaeon]|nr:translation initiation factor IF-2 subunit beta [Candidatus Bathyarchaeota archaeon]